MNKNNKGFLAATLAAFCFSLTGTVLKNAYASGLSTIQTLTLQSVLASCFLFVGLKAFAPHYLKISRAMLGKVAAIGIVGGLGTGIFFASSVNYQKASLSTLLLFTYPIWVALGVRVFFKRKLSRVEIVAMLTILLGTTLTAELYNLGSWPQGFAAMGIVLGALSAITYAFFNLAGETVLRDLNPWTVTAYAQFASSLTLIVTRPPFFIFHGTLTPFQWGAGLTLATLNSIAPFFFLVTAISLLGAQKAALISTLEVPLALFFAGLFLSERLTSIQLVGATLIIVSIVCLRIYESKKAVDLVAFKAVTEVRNGQ